MEQYQVEPTHSLTQVSGNWVIRAAETYSFPLSLSPHEVHSIMCLPRAGVGPVYLAFLHTPQICPQNALAPSPIPARQLICFYICVCEWELLSALYLLIVMICANAVKCHLTFVNFGLDGTDLRPLDFDLICRRSSWCWWWWWFVAEQGNASLSAYSSHFPSLYSSSFSHPHQIKTDWAAPTDNMGNCQVSHHFIQLGCFN